MVFHDSVGSRSLGSVIVLPLRCPDWEELLSGDLKETDIDPNMFVGAADRGSGVGLHVFHVEKADGVRIPGGFAAMALESARTVAEGKGWTILGFSGM